MRPTPVLLGDLALAAALRDPTRRAAAERDLLARELSVPEGPWRAAAHAGTAESGIGLLVLDGLLVRRVGHEQRFGAELLGPGDLLRPWQHDGEDHTSPFCTEWRVIQPLRLAVLDRAFAARMAPYPELGSELVGRALRRSRVLAVHMAIVQHPRVDRRLLLLLWDLADRYGAIDGNRAEVRLPLTHDLLSELVAVRRPTVTTALRDLAERGAVVRDERDRWRIRRPGEAAGAR